MSQQKISFDEIYDRATRIAAGEQNTLTEDLKLDPLKKFYLQYTHTPGQKVQGTLTPVEDNTEEFIAGRMTVFLTPAAKLAFEGNKAAAKILADKNSADQARIIKGEVIGGHLTHYQACDTLPKKFWITALYAEAFLGRNYNTLWFCNEIDNLPFIMISACIGNDESIKSILKKTKDKDLPNVNSALALGYAVANNHKAISTLPLTQETIHNIALGYAITGNEAKMQEYCNMGANKESIIEKYTNFQYFEDLERMTEWMDQNPAQYSLNSGPNMQMLGLFIGALGLTAVCVAFFALNVATLGLPIVATVAAAGLFALATGCTFFGVGCLQNKKFQVTAAEEKDGPHLPDDEAGLAMPYNDTLLGLT